MMKSTTNQPPGCLTAILQLFRGKTKSSDQPLPYRVRDDFLSTTERSFYHALAHAVQGRAVIFAKIRLADLFFVARPDKNIAYFNQIARRHVDFLLCDPKSIKPLFGIELDDSSHQRPERQARDRFVDQAFEAAGLPLVRIPAQRAYTASEITAQLQAYLDSTDGTANIAETSGQPAPEGPPAPPLCPKCGIPMVVRTVASGQHQGKQFYGCKNYPQCREMKPLK